ncbi:MULTISPECIES: carboxypeptidase regulatory-like domain-containing protein [unclassified Leptolyngbya]|uniref:carboxypeptidase regulatory-like domain-containing protein n=1 Tax=unclassified Leptolyngbya TaxID=2650499 RepID=UPI00168851EB|nr:MULTISPECIES: carboxypeptidase regulatory-like domain-containing protein [unclassified Leptolyngbya]MBD1912819.1 carboxypeptidase regulatory-like domain-containing protein [Leptolyngbya sp. FACHB-8]MBD2157766.1 carboxypeptidase regulatory-like domain-containing protein [Leptolyngbya sp. FACHB-16]
MKRLFVLLSLLVALFGFPSQAMAHAAWTDYQMLVDQFELTSVYSTGEPYSNAPVRIYAPNNTEQPWLEGNTDESGNFAFTPDTSLPGNWRIRIGEPGTDHGDILTVPVTAQGVQIDEISQNSFDKPHWWAQQTSVALGAFGSGLGSVLLLRRRRWFF